MMTANGKLSKVRAGLAPVLFVIEPITASRVSH